MLSNKFTKPFFYIVFKIIYKKIEIYNIQLFFNNFFYIKNYILKINLLCIYF